MTSRHMRNRMMVMMEFVMLIIFEVHANDLASLYLNPSSLPTRFTLPFHFDYVHGRQYNCLEIEVEAYKQKYEPESTDQGKCIIKNFVKCISTNRSVHEIYYISIGCLKSCFKEANGVNHHMAACLFECFEEKIKHHWDVIYIWIRWATRFGKRFLTSSLLSWTWLHSSNTC